MSQSKRYPTLLRFLLERGRIWILVGGALAGILLILLGGALGADENSEDATAQSEIYAQIQACEQALEKELAAICGEVAGVGHVDVLLRLESGTQIRYATDEGGKLLSTGSAGSKEALQETLLSPKVAGVAIVCRGGNDPDIQRKLTELVSTALGISAARVFVCGK